MLKKLSAHYQKEIALSFIAIFFTSGLSSLKAEIYSAVNEVHITTPASNSSNSRYNANTLRINNANAKNRSGSATFFNDGMDKGKRIKSTITGNRKNFSVALGNEKSGKPYIGG